jgi:hypothetical protein
MRLRALLYTSLALAAPPAFALGLAPGGNAAPAGLSAQASLDDCGVYESQIVCMIDTSFSQVEGADYYTASVSRPDGSVADFGAVSPGGTSLWVPYVGNGTYTVVVSAYGDNPERYRPKKPIEVAKAKTGGAAQEGSFTSTPKADNAAAPATHDPPSGNADGDVGEEPPATCTEEEPPPADEPEPDAEDADTDAAEPSADASTLQATTPVPEDKAQLPESVSGRACSPEEQP